MGWMSGALNIILDWRWTFRILGVAGVFMAPLSLLALWEPKSVRERRIERRKGKKVYSIKVSVSIVGIPCRPPIQNCKLIYSKRVLYSY